MKQNLEHYYKVLLGDTEYPQFIDKYLKSDELQRLLYIGQFCGCDYSNIYQPRFFYTRYHHSLATALMVYHFTKSKKQTICALLHDIGTPCFSHCIDYLLGDTEKQESSEMDVYQLISSSSYLLNCLKEDGIELKELEHPEDYPIVENEKPKLRVDRLDGVLHTCYIWLKTHSLEEIKNVYEHITVLKNDNNEDELGFDNILSAEAFYDMVDTYSIELQSCEDKYVMQYIADSLKVLINYKKIEISELYTKKESYFVDLLETNISSFKKFRETSSVSRSDRKPLHYSVSLTAKKRHVLPLVYHNGKINRLNEVSDKCQKLVENYTNYQDSKYVYVDTIEEIHDGRINKEYCLKIN